MSFRNLDVPGRLDHSQMQKLLGYSIAQASIPTSRIFQQSLGAPLGVSQVEYTILVLIQSNPGATSKQLCLSLDTTAARMSLLLDRMADRGWVEKSQSMDDKRSFHLGLTAAGSTFVKRALAVAETMERELLGHLTKVEQTILMELLAKIASQRAT